MHLYCKDSENEMYKYIIQAKEEINEIWETIWDKPTSEWQIGA